MLTRTFSARWITDVRAIHLTGAEDDAAAWSRSTDVLFDASAAIASEAAVRGGRRGAPRATKSSPLAVVDPRTMPGIRTRATTSLDLRGHVHAW